MKIDFWNNENTLKDVMKIDCFFYPNNGYYAGNMYDKTGKMIGDYLTYNSLEIEKTFPGLIKFL